LQHLRIDQMTRIGTARGGRRPRVTKRRWTMSNHGIFPRRRRDNDLDQDGPPDESRQG